MIINQTKDGVFLFARFENCYPCEVKIIFYWKCAMLFVEKKNHRYFDGFNLFSLRFWVELECINFICQHFSDKKLVPIVIIIRD